MKGRASEIFHDSLSIVKPANAKGLSSTPPILGANVLISNGNAEI